MNRSPTTDSSAVALAKADHSSLISYPARPVNGGRLESAPPKVGPWIAQPKIKDWRAIVHAPTQRIWNRHGQPMSITADLATPLMILSGCPLEWLDVAVMERQNQLLRRSIVVLDWVPARMENLVQEERRGVLKQEFNILPRATQLVDWPERHRTDAVFLISEFDHPHHFYQLLKVENHAIGGHSDDATDTKNFYEGIVCKRTDKPYPIQLLSPNKETPWMIKHRFDQ